MSSSDLDQVLHRLDLLVGLVAAALTRGGTRRENIGILSGAGFPPREIARLLGTTANAVSVELSRARKRPRKAAPRTEAES